MSVTMPERYCSRMLCNEPASVTLAFQYHQQTVHLGPLAATAEPHTYDLCGAHSLTTSAPVGWELTREPLSAVPAVPDAASGAATDTANVTATAAPTGAALSETVAGDLPEPVPARVSARMPARPAAPEVAEAESSAAQADESAGKRRGRRRKGRAETPQADPQAPMVVEPGRRGHLRLVVDNDRPS